MGQPDFLIVGAMKAGTTSLSSWLGSQPEVFVPLMKEPNFFSDERVWSRGPAWYRELFKDLAAGQIAGEASVAYTDPKTATVASARIAQMLPHVRLLFVVRDPIDRLRSHYRHEVLRGREGRRLTECLNDVHSDYVARSSYFASFEPFTRLFCREQIRVLQFEDLFGPSEEEWMNLLSFLQLKRRPRPGTQLNASADRAQFSPIMRALWDAGVRRPPRFVPAFLRRAIRPILLRRRQEPLLDSADDPVPSKIIGMLREDSDRLAAWLGTGSSR